ncbi:MAG: ABC transporter ATP-binding protein, partial [Chloroflexi bacterium]
LVGVRNLGNERVSSLSTGWRQRLALGTSIVHKPQLLFLDEPTSGVDPGSRRAFWDLIYELVEGGVSALVTTHYMDEAEYCGRVGIMREGKLLAMDSPSALKTGILPGSAWDIYAEPLMEALAALESCSCVLRAGLTGDHLRAITPFEMNEEDLAQSLSETNLHGFRFNRAEPTLEDVFLSLS